MRGPSRGAEGFRQSASDTGTGLELCKVTDGNWKLLEAQTEPPLGFLAETLHACGGRTDCRELSRVVPLSSRPDGPPHCVLADTQGQLQAPPQLTGPLTVTVSGFRGQAVWVQSLHGRLGF